MQVPATPEGSVGHRVSTQFYRHAPEPVLGDNPAGGEVQSGRLDVSVRYMGVNVYSKTGSICDAVPCPLPQGPAQLSFNQDMPSATPPVSASQ